MKVRTGSLEDAVSIVPVIGAGGSLRGWRARVERDGVTVFRSAMYRTADEARQAAAERERGCMRSSAVDA
jgi:hypothetical protein